MYTYITNFCIDLLNFAFCIFSESSNLLISHIETTSLKNQTLIKTSPFTLENKYPQVNIYEMTVYPFFSFRRWFVCLEIVVCLL
jgi:hypothetical protein